MLMLTLARMLSCTCMLTLGYLHLHTCTLAYLHLHAYTWILTLAYLHLDAFTCKLSLGCFSAIVSLEVQVFKRFSGRTLRNAFGNYVSSSYF